MFKGTTAISTINCSMRAYATAIVAAEYLLQWDVHINAFLARKRKTQFLVMSMCQRLHSHFQNDLYTPSEAIKMIYWTCLGPNLSYMYTIQSSG
ncbi:hypothetical protein AgCh_012624 [Apium graveolens]